MIMMQIGAFLLVILCVVPHVVLQGHRSFPPRGPPRPPPYPGFVKKWQHLQKIHLRGPPPQMRPRPIPMHSHLQKPKKHIAVNTLNRYFQSTPSVRPFWNSPSTTYRPLTEAPTYNQPTEKYTFVLPNQKHKQTPSKQKEYDFHIQTNQIPSGISSSLLNPIQQVGEKGPIHTIPAPNLSPADRPSNVEHVRPQVQAQDYVFEPEQQFQHEYHVTEASESVKFFRNQQQPQKNVQYYSQNNLGPTPSSQSPKITGNQHEIHFKSQNSGSQADPEEYYQVIHKIKDSNANSDDIPHHQFLQNIPNLELLMSEDVEKSKQLSPQQDHHQPHKQLFISEVTQPQQAPHGDYSIQPLFTADQRYVEEFQRMHNKGNPASIDLNPEFHSFNYNEQDYQKEQSKSSLVSAGYNLDYEPEASEIVHQTISRSAPEAHQSKHVHDSNADSLSSNDVEPNAAPNAETPVEENIDETPGYYSSLPNKEVADALASLQAAGKINSNLMQLSNRGPSREKSTEMFMAGSIDDSKPENIYDVQQDYEQLENDEDVESEIVNSSFGAKIKPKRN